MKNLISIYFSLFLVYSPLQAQTQENAKIYFKSGNIVEGSIVKIEEDKIIFMELRDSGELIEWKVINSMIYKLISQSGEVLILNNEFEDEFKEGEQRNRKLAKKLAIAFSKKHSQIRNVSWRISTSNGETLKANMIQFIEDDTLKIRFIDSANISYTKSVALGTINEIRIKKNTRILKYSLRGGLLGFWYSEFLAAVFLIEDLNNWPAFIIIPILFVPPGLALGAISGVIVGRMKFINSLVNLTPRYSL